MSFHKQIRRITAALNDALFPPVCLVCGGVFQPEKHRGGCPPHPSPEPLFDRLMAPFLCRTCCFGFLPVESPICTCCGVMFSSREGEDHLCGDCIASPGKFKTARASGVYDQALMSVIRCLKYKEKIQLARPLGRLLFIDFIRFYGRSGIDRVVPVPLHNKKLRARGFNQALLLVREWPRLAGELPPQTNPVLVDRDILVRSRWTKPQTGLGRKQRMANIKDAFGVPHPSKVEKQTILLVDDVYTTGATVNECAKVLRRAGAKQVDVLTLARAL